MFVLDTNVLSELIKPAPNTNVLAWFSSAVDDVVCTTTITVAEVWHGIQCMSDGNRKNMITLAMTELFEEDFRGGILEFDYASALVYGELGAMLRKRGYVIGQSDTMIAAIALRHEATVITRNTKHLNLTGVRCINPFS